MFRKPPASIHVGLGAVARPADYREDLAARARECVRLAAALTETESLADWFLRDERGVWEVESMRLLVLCETEKADAIAALGWSNDRVNEQVANALVLLGLRAMICAEARGL